MFARSHSWQAPSSVAEARGMNSATEYVRVITGVGKCNRSAAASS